jgi:acetyl esterase
MELDLHLAGFLQSLAQAGSKPLSQSTPEEGRAAMRYLASVVRAPEAIVQVHGVEDLTIPGAAGSLRARLYRPTPENHLPTIVFLHGGGFVIGDLDTHDNICRELARGTNAAVLAVDYRLAPEHRFPAAAEDAVAAARWAVANAGKLGGSSIVAIAGDSAGGNLAAVATQQLHAEGISLAAQLLIYPAVVQDRSDFPSFKENGEGYFLDLDGITWFDRHYVLDGTNRADARLAPMLAEDFTGLPPAVILTAEYDPLRDEGEAYGRALQASGVKVETIRCEGMIHGFFDMGGVSPGAQAWIEKGIASFRTMLGSVPRR